MLEILAYKRGIVNRAVSLVSPYGYKKDGTPRRQAPGPGRPRLDDAERDRRRKVSKSGWQAKNPEYMREYMRRRRAAVKEQKH
jgi:hypothetical protein